MIIMRSMGVARQESKALRVLQVVVLCSWLCFCEVSCTRRSFRFDGPSFPSIQSRSYSGGGNKYLPPSAPSGYGGNSAGGGTGNGNGLAYSHQHVNFFEDGGYTNKHRVTSDEEKWLCLVAGICSTWPSPTYGAGTLNPLYEWRQLDFDYPNARARQNDINSGAFVPGNGVPIDVEVIYSGNGHNKIFVTIPRFVAGIPVTLGTVSSNTKIDSVITPFPDWSWHQNPESCKPNRLVSVFRVKLDECGRLWVLDAGRVGDHIVCPPQIIAFDVNTKEVLHRYTIPSNQYESRSVFVTPIVDVRDPGQCRDTYVYAADCQSFAIVVYDAKKETSWRISNKLMYPFPTFGTYTISGETFELMDGVLGLSLQPFSPNRDRKLFFHSLSSNTENWVYTSVLRNRTLFMTDAGAAPQQFHVYENQRPSQSASSAIDRNGIQYFGMIQENSIGCWNIDTPYGKKNLQVLVHDDRTMQFASGVKIVNNKKGAQELWVVTSRLQKAFAGTLNPSETNFRILAAKTGDLTKGTKCHVFDTQGGSSFGGGFGSGGFSSGGFSSGSGYGGQKPSGEGIFFNQNSASSSHQINFPGRS